MRNAHSSVHAKAPLAGRFSLRGICQLVAALSLLTSWLLTEHFLPWVSWHAEVMVFAAIFLTSFLVVASRLAEGGWRVQVPVTRAVGIFAGLAVLALVQTIAGQILFAGDGIVLCLYFALYAMALALGHAAALSDRQPASDRLDTWTSSEILALTLVSGALLSSVIALAQVLELWESASWIVRMPVARRAGGNLGQPNQLATLLIMGVASLVFLFERRRLLAAPAVGLLLLLALGLAATESRTGALEYVLLLLWWLAMRRRIHSSLAVPVVVAAALACLGLFVSWPSILVATGSFAPGATLNASSSARLEVWAQLWDAVWIHPWLGWGLREVSRAQNAVVHAYDASQSFTYAHNIVLDLLLGAGIPLTLTLLVVSGIWLWRRVRLVDDPIKWYCVAITLVMGTHAMLEFPHAYAYLAVPALFLLGVLDALGKRPAWHLPAAPVLAAVMAAGLVGLWTVFEYIDVEEDFRIVRFESLHVGRTPDTYQRPHLHLLTQLDGLLQAGRSVPQPGMSDSAMDIARKSALQFPWPATQNRYALSLALNGEPREAERQVRVIRALHGERVYRDLKANWARLAKDKYPQLGQIVLP